MQFIEGILLLSIVAMAFLWVFVQGQLAMKAKIARQIDWGIKNGKITLEVNGIPKSANELYAVICARDYPKK